MRVSLDRAVNIAIILACAMAAIRAGSAQGQQDRIGFDVASIKPFDPEHAGPIAGVRVRGGCYGGPGSGDPGRLHCGEITILGLIRYAYRVPEYQIEYPKGLDDNKFEIIAKVPETANKEQIPPMVQTLLAERFKLKLHTEERLIAGYELIAGKGPPKIQKVGEIVANGGSPGFAQRTAEGLWTLHGWRSMEGLATFLSSRIRRPVGDSTGLTGLYAVTLSWSESALSTAALTPEGAATRFDDLGPTIFEAVQNQLGLRLVSKKIPVKVFVIDRVEKAPTEN